VIQSRFRLALAWVACPLLLALPAHAQSEKLTVQLDWTASAQFAGILVAQQRGLYLNHGLDVTVLPADESMQTVRLTAEHPDWIGVTEADVLLVEHAKGYPVKAFATMLQTTPFALFTLNSSGLTSIPSLRGKTIGLHDDGQKAVDVLLKFNHMTRSDVKVVDVPYSLDPLLTGKVDAMQGYTIDEGVRLGLEHHAVNTIRMADNGYSSYAELLIASETLLRTHPDQLARFVVATDEGWRFAAAHPAETAQMIVTHFLTAGNLEEQRRSLEVILPLLSAESPRFGEMRDSTWQAALQMFDRYQLSATHFQLSDVVDHSILRAVYSNQPSAAAGPPAP
jgi:NitT/TauT family transport system substrate-binding protein